MKKNEALIERLLSSNAREQANQIALEAIQNKVLLRDLIYLFINEAYRVTQRVSWVLVLLAEKELTMLSPFEKELLTSIQNKDVGDAVKRNVMRVWSITGVSEKVESLVYDICISYLIGHEAIAIKVHAMSVAFGIAKPWPELCQELKVAVEDVLLREGASAGIRSKCNRLIKELNKRV